MARFALVALALAISLGAQEKPVPEQPPDARPASKEDPGRPVLRRGGPAQRHEQTAPSAPSNAKSLQAAAGDVVEVDESGRTVDKEGGQDPPLIQRAREAAIAYDNQLPNYICDEFVTRWQTLTLPPVWETQPVVEAELTYFDGKEEYRNIRVNGKRIKKGGPEDSGTWSYNEFGSMLKVVMGGRLGRSSLRVGLRGPPGSPSGPLTSESSSRHHNG
jgi:hypothetical protein